MLDAVILAPDERLLRVAARVDGADDVEAIVRRMQQFIDGRVLGLAAPQIGIAKRVVVINFADMPVVMVNPRIIEQSVERTVSSESCLSLPSRRFLVGRPSMIVVDYRNADGVARQERATGYRAKCILHEMDHLDGILVDSHGTEIADA